MDKRTRSRKVNAGAEDETGEEIHDFLVTLAQRSAPGLDSVCFLRMRPCGTVQLLHSLFALPFDPYEDTPPRLCALSGADPPLAITLPPMAFTANAPFLGSAEEDFEAHVTGLDTTERRLDENAIQIATEEDDGARQILSRGLIFLSGAALTIFLELGEDPTIAAAACALVPYFLRTDTPHNNLASLWLQASFTKLADGRFVGGPIRTVRDLSPVDTSESAFCRQTVAARVNRTFPPPSPPNSPGSSRASSAPPELTPPAAHDDGNGEDPAGVLGSGFNNLRDRLGSLGSGRRPGRHPTFGGSIGSGPPSPPVQVDIAAIVTAAVNAASQGITAATTAHASSGTAPAHAPMSDLKLLHLRMICGVSTNGGIPTIWGEVAAAPNKQQGLAMLVQYLMGDMASCRRTYMGHSDLLHCSVPLYNFVAGDRFVNPGENPACPAGGMSMWTTLQGTGDVGDRIASADADLTALDGRNVKADQVARASKVHLQPISGATNLQREVGTKTYILAKLFGGACPLVEGYTTVVDWIDSNFTSFERQVNTTSACTAFAYDLSRTEAAYYNACIRASTTALPSDPGGRTPVSFSMLLDELTWGRYRGQPLPASLQTLIPPTGTTPLHTPQDTSGGGPPPSDDPPNPPGSGRGSGREGDPIANPRPIPRLRLLAGENTRDVLRRTPLPTMNGCTFCKRWHMGMSCWTRCARVASHKHPPNAIISTVADALVAERAAAVAAAAGGGN